MAVSPQTEIRLLKVPFELDNKNQLTFANITAQTNYFLNLPNLQEDNCTYQRKDNVIRFPSHIDDILTYNYVMYQNENYTNKWFYAFITEMRYINDNVTEISIATDVFQTWQFDIVYKRMFVEREHVSDDTIGLHTIPENLDVGEVIEDGYTEFNSLADNYYFALMSSVDPSTQTEYIGVNNYNGNLFGKGIYLFETDAVGILGLSYFLAHTNQLGKIESIEALFVVPKLLCENTVTRTDTYNNISYEYKYLTRNAEAFIEDYSDIVGYHFSDFTPKNRKMLCISL